MAYTRETLPDWIARLNWIGSLTDTERQALRDECAARGHHIKSGEYFAVQPPLHVCAHCADEFRD